MNRKENNFFEGVSIGFLIGIMVYSVMIKANGLDLMKDLKRIYPEIKVVGEFWSKALDEGKIHEIETTPEFRHAMTVISGKVKELDLDLPKEEK